jgi:hypothetical protein
MLSMSFGYFENILICVFMFFVLFKFTRNSEILFVCVCVCVLLIFKITTVYL